LRVTGAVLRLSCLTFARWREACARLSTWLEEVQFSG
jgi:hypothetical protein